MFNEAARFGLAQVDLNRIIEVLKLHPEVQRGAIFGSRALGTFKRGSDIDIALFGNLKDETVLNISYQLNEELPLPYFFDIVDFHAITNLDLKEHIERVGIVFYKAQ